MSSYLERLILGRLSGNGPSLPNDEQARKEFPLLWQCLTTITAFETQKKVPMRMSLSLGVGAWMCGLSDESLAMSLETQAGTLLEAFAALERALGSGTAWRTWSKKDPKLQLPEKKTKKKR